jgi:hypothetical protein
MLDAQQNLGKVRSSSMTQDHTVVKTQMLKKCAACMLLVYSRAVVDAQSSSPDLPVTNVAPTSENKPESRHLLGIVPNYRSSPSLQNLQPLSPGEKFKMASEDAFDRGNIVLASIAGGEGQLTNANRSFGQGGAGFARYFGAAYGDIAIADYLTEGVFPALLHQDPRYFRKGQGSGWSRLRYAARQIFWTHTDSGSTQFNYSEIAGNATGVAISNAYYADNRTAGDAADKLGVQIGVDMAGNVLKEFWPDLQRKFRRLR